MNIDSIPPNNRARFRTFIKQLEDPESILDVGCARHSKSQRDAGNLHQYLHESFPDADIMGIDILEEQIELMQEEGYNVVVEDAETMDLEQKFAVVIAGEVIEHLGNPGAFLDRAAEHVIDGGKIVLSTPNPDGFVYWRKALTGNSNNPTHTCWIDPQNLEQLVSLSESTIELTNIEYLSPHGGVSEVLWRLGFSRAASPNYVAVLEIE